MAENAVLALERYFQSHPIDRGLFLRGYEDGSEGAGRILKALSKMPEGRLWNFLVALGLADEEAGELDRSITQICLEFAACIRN